MSTEHADLGKKRIEDIVLATNEADFEKAFSDSFTPDVKIDINGKTTDFEGFKAISKQQLAMTDRKLEWKAVFATADGTFPPDLQPELQTIGFYYTLSAKLGERSIVQHRLGITNVDKDMKGVNMKVTLKLE